MKQKFFEIGNNQITMFPNNIWKVAGHAVAIAVPACWLAFLVWAGLLQLFPVLLMAAVNAVFVLPFFYVGGKQIIIDGATQTVQCKSWFGIIRICTFDDIEEVLIVNVMVYNSPTGGYYKLIYKKNPYGKGIQLSMGLGKTTKQFAMLQNTAIPFIKNLLATYDSEVQSDSEKNIIEKEAGGFSMFRQINDVFISKPIKTVNLVIAIVFLGLGIFAMLAFLTNVRSGKEFYWIFIFIAAIVNIGIWGERVKINPAEKKIEKSYLGLFKKTYFYKRIARFNTLKHINGLDNPTDIRVEIDNETSIQEITLFSRVGSAKKVQTLMEEVKRILKN